VHILFLLRFVRRQEIEYFAGILCKDFENRPQFNVKSRAILCLQVGRREFQTLQIRNILVSSNRTPEQGGPATAPTTTPTPAQPASANAAPSDEGFFTLELYQAILVIAACAILIFALLLVVLWLYRSQHARKAKHGLQGDNESFGRGSGEIGSSPARIRDTLLPLGQLSQVPEGTEPGSRFSTSQGLTTRFDSVMPSPIPSHAASELCATGDSIVSRTGSMHDIGAPNADHLCNASTERLFTDAALNSEVSEAQMSTPQGTSRRAFDIVRKTSHESQQHGGEIVSSKHLDCNTGAPIATCATTIATVTGAQPAIATSEARTEYVPPSEDQGSQCEHSNAVANGLHKTAVQGADIAQHQVAVPDAAVAAIQGSSCSSNGKLANSKPGEIVPADEPAIKTVSPAADSPTLSPSKCNHTQAEDAFDAECRALCATLQQLHMHPHAQQAPNSATARSEAHMPEAEGAPKLKPSAAVYVSAWTGGDRSSDGMHDTRTLASSVTPYALSPRLSQLLSPRGLGNFQNNLKALRSATCATAALFAALCC
jgi:hypothetical protein